MKCLLCNKEVTEVCNDLVCRTCHVSLDFDECKSGEFNRKYLNMHMMPFYDQTRTD
jgi:hypothetical protein